MATESSRGESGPDLIFVGQSTIDDVVPAEPGPWKRSVGGSALYAIAGARLWIDPARIGIATRTGKFYPFDLEGLLREAGVGHVSITPGGRRTSDRMADL